jgi:hypothetical protein
VEVDGFTRKKRKMLARSNCKAILHTNQLQFREVARNESDPLDSIFI